jgi:2-C-methyl-D-erythritol 4-phosphate cytidylyltransferase
LRDSEKGLSTGEKQMFVKAKKILASELMYAKDMDEEEAAEWLDGVLVGTENGSPQQPERSQEDHRREAREGRVQERREACRARQPPSRLRRPSRRQRRAPPRGERLGRPRCSRGGGDRLGADRPKAFARLGDEPLLAQSLKRLDDSDWVDFIVVAAPPGWEEPAILLAEELGCSKVSSCVTGGATRGESVERALAEVPEDAAVVLVHDAARPLVSDEVIERVVTALNDGWDGALPGLPLADTIKRVDDEGRVVETLNRDELRAVQTPQAFVASVVREAYARGDVAAASDCSSLVEARGGRVRVVEGDPKLIKVTDVGDLERVAALL